MVGELLYGVLSSMKMPYDFSLAGRCRTYTVFGSLLTIALLSSLSFRCTARAVEPLPIVTGVELQPFAAQVKRVIDASQALGSPFTEAEKSDINAASHSTDADAATAAIQRILDARCLFFVEINPESRVKVRSGVAAPVLFGEGWKQFLIKVRNEAGVTGALNVTSKSALTLGEGMSELSPRSASDKVFSADEMLVQNRWLDMQLSTQQPLQPKLSGLGLEYRIIYLYSRDAGKREATIAFDVEQGTQDLGFRGEVSLLFNCLPAAEVRFRVKDVDGKPTTASFVIRDHAGLIYPAQGKRLAPDMPFQKQIYRADGETQRLPAGEYLVTYTRGPEYVVKEIKMTVDPQGSEWDFQLERWFDAQKLGWWSGDHHIHAAGCAHYAKPTQGVLAVDMIRHCIGEDLNVGCNLTWGPCFDYQKQFFTGADDPVSQADNILHYDVEVSGFGSHESGHLCLLGLKDQIPPGGDSDTHWPTLGLNTLRWAKKQGAICGPAHSGNGLNVEGEEVPNFHIPAFTGIGAMEYIADVTHTLPGPDGTLVPAVDFLAIMDTPSSWELNMWYQTLNAGYRTRVSGETDFPCVYADRVGMGRSYVHLNGKLNFHEWIKGIQEGRSYVSDGKSHLYDFVATEANAKGSPTSVKMGENGSELKLAAPGTVHFTIRAAALLDAEPNKRIQNSRVTDMPYWDIERARIGDSRDVMLELIVNGYPKAKIKIHADGQDRDYAFDMPIERSSWVAVRVLASSHTNPIWISVGDKPVRPSRRSVQWCLDSVDKCWKEKERTYKPEEHEAAVATYEHARAEYRKILAECEVD